MNNRLKKWIYWGVPSCIILALFFFVALPYWILPSIINSFACTAMLNAGLTNPELSVKHITLSSAKITNIRFESNGIQIHCPEINANYSPISLLRKEINSFYIADASIELAEVLPQEAKDMLVSTIVTLKLDIKNKDNFYIGKLNGDLLGGNYSSDISFDIEKGILVIDGRINPILKDEFPTPNFTLNYQITDCYTSAPKGSGDLVIPDTNLKLGTNLSVKNGVVNISTALNSVVSKSDPYIERLFAKVDKQNLINSFYTEIYSKFSVQLAPDSQLPAWDLSVRFNEFKADVAMEDNKELELQKGMATIHISGLGEKIKLHTIPIYVKSICVDNLEFTNGQFKILADEEELLLSEGKINAFGGTLSVYALYLNFNKLNAGFTVFIDDVEIDKLITALPKLEGTGTGTLHGKFPVSIYNGKKLKLHNAYLLSKPGVTGKLKLSDTRLLQDALLDSGIPRQTCSDLGLALSDLDYSVIRLELIDIHNGEQALQLQIEGVSEQKKSTIPVNLNVNIHGGIESVLNIGLRSQGILQ